MSVLRLLLLSSAPLFLACGARSEVRESGPADAGDPNAPPPARGVMMIWCNGPATVAIDFSMGSPEPACWGDIQPDQRVVNLTMLRNTGEVPQGNVTIPVIYGTSPTTAFADVCVGSKESCEAAIGGSLTLADFNPSGEFADGSYILKFSHKDPIAGTFHVARCAEIGGGGCF